MMRITPAMMAEHKSKDDCWQAYGGKVYNVTEFLPYHPGGVPQLMRAAGRDGERSSATLYIVNRTTDMTGDKP